MTTAGSGQARKTVTVLFCDLTGSTALGEQLDPEALREVIQRYFDEMRSVIERHGGTVEKFIGDAVMAVFGVPRVREDDALRAVRAAVDMQSALGDANVAFERDLGVRIEARIGVHTGEVIAGDPATGGSFVSGDAVNVAARLEQAAEPGEILIGETTHRLVRAAVIAEPLPPAQLKGKAEPVAAYRLVVVEPGSEMLPRRLDAPLVGRERELETLKNAFEKAAGASQVHLLTVIGEAGLGKSRLALELLSAVEGKSRVLRGRCLPYGEGITFWPVNEILETAAGIEATGSKDDACAKVQDLLPPEHAALGRRLAAMLGGGGASGAIQETFLAVRRWLEYYAAEKPVVIVFDDIQWGEGAFLDLVQYLATFVAASPLFLLCLARPELLEVRPDWAEVGSTIRLEPLEATSSAAMIANLLGGDRTNDEVSATIVSAAAGNPLFIEEMLRMLVDHGAIALREGRWVVGEDLATVGTPETVQAVIAARLDRLDPADRKVLQVASVVGEVFWWGAVADLADDAAPAETGRRLQGLVRKDLIRPDADVSFGEDSFRFGHLLIRDVAYESLPKRARAALHERFAGWVADRAGERSAEYDEIIGYHAELAHRYLRELAPTDERIAALGVTAAGRLASAGERALARGDMPATRNLLSRAVSLHPATDARRVGLLMMLANALSEGGSLGDALRAYEEAIEGARAIGDVRGELLAVIRRVTVHMLSSATATHHEALAEAERLRPLFEAMDDDTGLAETFRVIGIVHIWAGRCQDAIEVLGMAQAHARRAGDRRLERDLMFWECLAIREGPMPAEDGLRRIRARSADYAEEAVLQDWTPAYLSELEAMRGRFAEARSLAEESISVAKELGLEVKLAAGLLRAKAFVEWLSGNLAAAENVLRQGVDILVRIKDVGHLASVAPDLALVLLDMEGRDQEALRVLELGEAGMIEEDVDAQVRARSARARLHARLGDVVLAERYAREAVARAWATDYANLRALSVEALADVLHRAGRIDESAEALERAIEVQDAKGNIVAAEADRRLLAEHRATTTPRER